MSTSSLYDRRRKNSPVRIRNNRHSAYDNDDPSVRNSPGRSKSMPVLSRRFDQLMEDDGNDYYLYGNPSIEKFRSSIPPPMSLRSKTSRRRSPGVRGAEIECDTYSGRRSAESVSIETRDGNDESYTSTSFPRSGNILGGNSSESRQRTLATRILSVEEHLERIAESLGHMSIAMVQLQENQQQQYEHIHRKMAATEARQNHHQVEIEDFQKNQQDQMDETIRHLNRTLEAVTSLGKTVSVHGRRVSTNEGDITDLNERTLDLEHGMERLGVNQQTDKRRPPSRNRSLANTSTDSSDNIQRIKDRARENVEKNKDRRFAPSRSKSEASVSRQHQQHRFQQRRHANNNNLGINTGTTPQSYAPVTQTLLGSPPGYVFGGGGGTMRMDPVAKAEYLAMIRSSNKAINEINKRRAKTHERNLANHQQYLASADEDCRHVVQNLAMASAAAGMNDDATLSTLHNAAHQAYANPARVAFDLSVSSGSTSSM